MGNDTRTEVLLTDIDPEQYAKAVLEGPDCFKWGYYDLCYGYSGVRYDTTEDKEEEVKELVSVFRGTGVGLYVHIMPRNMGAEVFRRRARKLYEWGVDGIGLWDTEFRSVCRRDFTMMARLGHREALATYDTKDGDWFRNHNIVKIGLHRIDRYAPHWGC